MKNLYNKTRAKGLNDLELRVYTSRLLGSSSDLVLDGEGSTSVKIEDLLYISSGNWNLATIEKEGFLPLRTIELIKLLQYERLTNSDMIQYQQEALIDENKNLANLSIDALLHALIPYKFVDHTHADAIIAISNSYRGEELISEIYKDYLIVPYVMPGFLLSKMVYNMTEEMDWDNIQGIILHNHGIFTFANSAKESYDSMIEAVSLAENYIKYSKKKKKHNLTKIKEIISNAKGYEVVMRINQSVIAKKFASKEDMALSQKGVLIPEHIIKTKRVPIIFEDDYEKELERYIEEYIEYFNEYSIGDEVMLNPAPNWAILKDFGTVSFGRDEMEAKVIEDINNHTMRAMIDAKRFGGYRGISKQDSFYMEYWQQ
jgi:rhamnose utilization protein RhaD (predicted bifunctional aldolase and dehydrogenase)